MSSAPTVVLVHGAWADASTWSHVVPVLQRAEVSVVAFANPLRGIAADAAGLGALLAAREGPFVLVGHSYGGFVISTAAAANPGVASLVYVNAFAADEGESIAGLTQAVPGSELAGEAPALFDFVPIPGGGGDVDLYVKPDVFTHAFTNGLSAEQAATLAASQRPLPASVIQEAAPAPGWKGTRSWYVVGSEDRVIPPAGQGFMAQRAGSAVTELAAGHLSMLTHGEDVANVILAAVRSN